MRPDRAADFRARAHDCEAVAQLMSDSVAKQTFQKQAQKWLRMAGQAKTDEGERPPVTYTPFEGKKRATFIR
jgi:hypothetical protein